MQTENNECKKCVMNNFCNRKGIKQEIVNN